MSFYLGYIRRIEDCIDCIGSLLFVSKFILLKGHWQVPLSEQAKVISAFATPDGLYQYKVMPFGMRNVPATFQQMINHIIAGLEGCATYLYDAIVYSQAIKDHMLWLHNFLHRLNKENLTIDLTKSEFCR